MAKILVTGGAGYIGSVLVPELLLAWNFKKEILANNKALLDKGVEFYFPVDLKVS